MGSVLFGCFLGGASGETKGASLFFWLDVDGVGLFGGAFSEADAVGVVFSLATFLGLFWAMRDDFLLDLPPKGMLEKQC